MNPSDSANNETTYGWHADANGNPDFSNPITKQEAVDMYHNTADSEPTLLTDLYKDFYIFSRVEFLIFNDRVCSAILLFRSTKKQLKVLESELISDHQSNLKVTHGWEGEMNMVFEESIYMIRDTSKIAIGASIVTAVAALESLLIDLMPENEEYPNGLHNLMQAFLKQHKVSKSLRKKMTGLELILGERRNTFAHTLTGSYFSNDQKTNEIFTEKTLDDTLYKVCQLAIMMEKSLG